MDKDPTSSGARSDSDGASTLDLSGRCVGSSYILIRPIGQGATGTVWRGVDRASGEPVAVKLLHESLLRQPKLVTRFVQERTILLMLRHRNVVRVRDLFSVGESLGLVMDLVAGRQPARAPARAPHRCRPARRPGWPRRSPPRWPRRTSSACPPRPQAGQHPAADRERPAGHPADRLRHRPGAQHARADHAERGGRHAALHGAGGVPRRRGQPGRRRVRARRPALRDGLRPAAVRQRHRRRPDAPAPGRATRSAGRASRTRCGTSSGPAWSASRGCARRRRNWSPSSAPWPGRRRTHRPLPPAEPANARAGPDAGRRPRRSAASSPATAPAAAGATRRRAGGGPARAR